MVEDEDKKDEEKFEFTPEGEALGYISSDQARILAIQHARDNRDFYGRRYRRVSDNSVPDGGPDLGVRSGGSGHPNNALCTATTYHARFRHDGDMEFFKELKHPDGKSREKYPIWGGDSLPHNQWIGMKFVVYNIDEDQHVKLEVYRDLNDGTNGGSWEQLAETIDAGGWAPKHDCEYAPDFIPVKGGGVVFISNKNVHETQYKNFSIREIVPK